MHSPFGLHQKTRDALVAIVGRTREHRRQLTVYPSVFQRLVVDYQLLPSRTARVVIDATSLPASASLRQ